MTTELLDAFLWRAGAAIRIDGLPTYAGHGLADPLYRPPRLPYASVLGPLSYSVEPERDLPRQVALNVRTPGYLGGVRRDPAVDVLPPAGELNLVIDDEVVVTLALDHGPDEGELLTAARGLALATRMQDALVAAAVAAVDLDGAAIDAERRADIAETTVRWDNPHERLVIASSRFGPVGDTAVGASSVRLHPDLASDQAAPLGLAEGDPLAEPPIPGAVAPVGRVVRHQVPTPIAMSFEMRVDLWAGSQRHLAALVEAWARITPTRCQLLVRPALLAGDVAANDTTIPLQTAGESPTRWTIAQLEPGVQFANRRTGESVELIDGATAQPDGLFLPADGLATMSLLPPSPIPDPFAPDHPAVMGWALALNVRVDAPPLAAARMLLAELEHDGQSALRIELVWAVPPTNGGLEPLIEVHAQSATGDPLDPVSLPITDAALAAGIEVHGLVDAAQGQLAVFAGGEAAAGPATGPIRPAGGDNTLLRIGAAGAPAPCVIGHVQVIARPLGPLDHRQRRSLSASNRWRPGDAVTLARTDDGFTPKGNAFTAVVVAVNDNELVLDRPVVGNWPRHDTLVGSRVVFSQQTQVRRRDDLASNIARMSISHSVSGFIDPFDAGTSARLVETMDLQVRDRAIVVVPEDGSAPPSTRRRDSAPTIEGEIVPARVLVTHRPDGDEPPGAEEIERVPQAPSTDPPE